MPAVLVNKPLFGDAPLAVEVAFVGLLVGAGFGWLLLEGPFVRTEPNRIVWSAVAFLGLHSVGDGLVLGRDFVGGVVPTVPIDGLTIGRTMAHRFVEVAWSSSRRSGAVGRRDSRWSSFSWASHPFPPPTFRAWSSPPTAVSFAPSSQLRSRRSLPRSRRPLACFYSSAGSFRLLRRAPAPPGPRGRPRGHRPPPPPLLSPGRAPP